MAFKRRISGGKPGEIFYRPHGTFEVFQVIERHEGYKDNYGYSDPNADTIICWDFIAQKETKFDSRSIFADMYIWDMGGTSSAAGDLGFSDRHACIITRLFEELG